LQRAYESNERQLYIIDDILRVAKVDMGKTLIQKKKVDLAALLRNIIDEQTDRFYSHNQKLALGLPDKLIVPVDASQLHMAIGNIIDNAIKYSPDGKRITIRLEQIDPKTIELEIRDQGVGIAEEDIEKLFTKFMRIPNSRSIEVGGTGLGLYWTKRIIELHGGTITVHSKIGKGTSFSIKLPMK
jgi:two-component system phosphate regulon sensor histidine kinase PhoR